MRRIVFIFIFFCSFSTRAQVSKLYLNISSHEDSPCYRLRVTRMSDTIVSQSVYTNLEKNLDSLLPGTYKIYLYKCSDPAELSIVKNVVLNPDSLTECYIDLDFYIDEKHVEINKKTREKIVKEKGEIQGHFSCLYTDWIEKKSPLQFSPTAGITFYNWQSFSKYVGFLTGIGFGAGHYGFADDTTFMNLTTAKKNYEYYNYLDGHVDSKFRITLKSQQKGYDVGNTFFLDMGVTYNVPVLFKHVAQYENSKKIVNKHLHQFTDLRCYVNIGFSHVSVFAEYRLLDFIIGSYPELPKYNFGIRINGALDSM